MKKFKLSESNLGNAEILTREQLKNVLGGLSSDPGDIICLNCPDNDPNGCVQVTCPSGQSLYDCTIDCDSVPGYSCGGCAQFPGPLV